MSEINLHIYMLVLYTFKTELLIYLLSKIGNTQVCELFQAQYYSMEIQGKKE